LPLVAKGLVKGVMEVYQHGLISFDQDQNTFLHMLAGEAAISIDTAQLFENLQGSRIDLLVAYDETIKGWSQAMDLRDRESEGHTRRVTEQTVKLAACLGFSAEELIHIRHGALLHEIGMMRVPDEILQKTGPRSEDERKVMQKHPQFAYDLLASITYLQPALDIPYCHHENWDGSGYPRGLKGKQIPLAARIFAVADAWDTLTSDRPYRVAWPKEKALGYIQEQSGTKFDPMVAILFMNDIKDQMIMNVEDVEKLVKV
jgi:HD-GYP domain-containing protein (c-di-GMP phosphodiesterase class II)